MERKFTFRLFPTEEQKKFFDINFYCSRVVYEYFLKKIKYDEEVKKLEFGKSIFEFGYDKILTQLKKQNDFSFLKEADSKSLQGAVNKLFHDVHNSREYHGIKYPVYKLLKNQKNLYRIMQNLNEKSIYLCSYGLKVPKIDVVQLNQTHYISSSWKITKVDIYQTYTDRYYAKITFDCGDEEEEK